MYYNKNYDSLDYILEENLCFKGSELSARKLNNLNESQKIKISDKIAAKILSSIKGKMNKPEYKIIEKSKGDFTKFESYSDIQSLSSYLKRLSDMDINSTVDFKNAMNIINDSINFLSSNKYQFMKSFKNNNSIIICLYDATVIGIVECLSLVTSTCIEVETDNYNFTIKAKQSYKRDVTKNKLFKSLQDILKTYSNKKINKVFNLEKEDMSNIVKNESGAIVAVGLTLVAVILILLFGIRHIIFFFYTSKIKLSEHLSQTSEMVKINTVSLGHDERGEKIREKQLKWAEKLDNWSQKLYVDVNFTSQKVDREIEEQDKEISSETSTNYGGDTILI